MGAVVKRCGVRAISSGRLSNSKNDPMTVHPFGKIESLLKPQPQPLQSPTEECQPFNYKKPKSFAERVGMTLLASLLVFAIFGEDSSNRQNRLLMRLNGAQIGEAIIILNHLSRPMPWEAEPSDNK